MSSQGHRIELEAPGTPHKNKKCMERWKKIERKRKETVARSIYRNLGGTLKGEKSAGTACKRPCKCNSEVGMNHINVTFSNLGSGITWFTIASKASCVLWEK